MDFTKRIITVVLLLCTLCTVANAQNPRWIKWPKVRESNNPRFGKTLNDVESHIRAGHHYSFPDAPMTSTHEVTHGINSDIRMKHSARSNGFYCLEDRAVVFAEPKITIANVAAKVPASLRGPSFNLYLIEQRKYWNDRPLYLVDEWVAYTNGTCTGQELGEQGWYYELLQSHNFSVYCAVMLSEVKQRQPDYDLGDLKEFSKWNIKRVHELTNRPLLPAKNAIGQNATPYQRSQEYIALVQTAKDAEQFRSETRDLLGADFCKEVMGF